MKNKCHFPSCLDISTKFSIPDGILENEDSQKLLGVTIDKKLIFNEQHVTKLCDQKQKN